MSAPTKLPRWAELALLPLLNLGFALLLSGVIVRLLGESPWAALKLMVGDLHAQRETFVLGDAAYRVQTSVTVDALLRPYMVMRP